LFKTIDHGSPPGGDVLVEFCRENEAKNNSARREPLEEGRDGLVEGHFVFYFNANPQQDEMIGMG
jgi:hypothetical protein